MAIYLGSIGAMTQIHPLTDIEITPTRYGGTHVSLTGRRVIDFLGASNAYELKWKMMTPEEAKLLYSLYYRHTTEPVRFILGDMMPNLLSRSAASTGFGGRDMSGVKCLVETGTAISGAVFPSTDWPTEVFPAGTSLRWNGYDDGSYVTFDSDQKVPLIPGQRFTFSVWVKSASADEVQIRIDKSDNAPSWGQYYTLTPGVWTKLVYTPATNALTDVTWVNPGVVVTNLAVDSAKEMIVAAAQLEYGTAATEWKFGGGAPSVIVDEMTTPSPYGKFVSPEMTLLEV